jgi:hypothetical protein
MCYIFIDINNVLCWYNFVLYWCDAFIIIKWLKQLTCMIYTKKITICILIVINMKINKQINSSLSITKKCNKNKTFTNVFGTTKKCYKLACMDGIKTWPLCLINIPSRLDEK